MSRVIGVAAAAGCAALMVAGCGTTHAAGTGPAAPAKPVTKSETPQQRASADAESILSSFVPPKGALRLPSAPESALGTPAAIRGAQNVVQKTAYWQVKGSPQAVLAWEKAHLPRQFTATGSGTIAGPGAGQVQEDNFTLPAVPGVLPARGLEVAAVSTAGGQSELRVDSQVTWVPTKPLTERIPDSARVVTFSASTGMVAGAKHPSPVTITKAATVQRLESLVNGLPLLPPGLRSCPADLGRSIQLTFSATQGGTPLAVANIPSSGCQGVQVTVQGKAQPVLDGGGGAAAQALSIAGVNWPGYGSGAGGSHLPSGVNPGGTMQHGGA